MPVRVAAIVSVLLVGSFLIAGRVLPEIVAGAVLHPDRTTARAQLPEGCVDRQFESDGIRIVGWQCRASVPARGTVVYLHGIADNRASASGIVERFRSQGFDVIAYDGRAHGDSGGDACTYGYFEKRDLRRVLDQVSPALPVILIGQSLGGAVALQAAVGDPRVATVVAAEVFSDLASVVHDRAPALVPNWILARGLRLAEQRGRFVVANVSPVRAAAELRIPVLLIHGARDVDTSAEHSRRVFAALGGRKRLIIVEHARHNESLRDAAVWSEIDRWIDAAVAPPARIGAS